MNRQFSPLALVSDHAGFALRSRISKILTRRGITVLDFGPKRLAPDDDYPLTIRPLIRWIAQEPQRKGVALCHSGVGMAIAANKFRGIRAVLARDVWTATQSRRDEDANVLALGVRGVATRDAIRIIVAWLKATPSTAARHRRRRRQILTLDRALPGG